MSNKYENVIPPLLQDWSVKLHDKTSPLYLRDNYRNLFLYIKEFSEEQIRLYDKEKKSNKK